ncbi:tetratricopeptide repeat protein 31 [Monodelphis domestica]|uniref:tetratricopeptide repeat protein 31 n=1 Tax=Monodelphis domestica TaxID=13616 RepID=UPI0024E1B2BD|nr:tetratricopeptide repeat protein 31 [Monodelphis domestica]
METVVGYSCGIMPPTQTLVQPQPPPPSSAVLPALLAHPYSNWRCPRSCCSLRRKLTRLAEELVAEEERANRGAEKKRLKKKIERLRTAVLLDVSNQVIEEAAVAAGPAAEASNFNSSPQSPSQGSSNEEEELDLSSTFVSQAPHKVGDWPPNTQKEKVLIPEPPALNSQSQSPQEGSRSQSPQLEALPGLQAAALRQSQELAELGTAAAWRGLYQEAVLLFTKAIELNPRDYRLFGNWSFCHKRLGQPGWALGDASVALNLHPQWPRGLFQLGKALVELQRFKEASDVFRETLAMDKSQPDAVHELQQCLLQLTLMRGHIKQSPPLSPSFFLPTHPPVPSSHLPTIPHLTLRQL